MLNRVSVPFGDSMKKDKTSDEDLNHLADFFKVMGDFTRLRILNILMKGEMNVGKITESLNMESSAISHQLRVLKQAKLVKSRREGKLIFYSFDDDHISEIFRQGLEHVLE